jgi:MinD superfamily P-loop ATPase
MLVLVVTEPSVSAEHDRERVLSLTRHFSIPAAVRGNIWDVSPAMTGHIKEAVRCAGARIARRIRYERAVTQAQPAETAVVETETPCADGLRSIWNHRSLQEEST